MMMYVKSRDGKLILSLPEGFQEGIYKLEVKDQQILLSPTNFKAVFDNSEDFVLEAKSEVGLSWDVCTLNFHRLDTQFMKDYKINKEEHNSDDDNPIPLWETILNSDYTIVETVNSLDDLPPLILSVLIENYLNESAVVMFYDGMDDSTSIQTEGYVAIKIDDFNWKMEPFKEWIKNS